MRAGDRKLRAVSGDAAYKRHVISRRAPDLWRGNGRMCAYHIGNREPGTGSRTAGCFHGAPRLASTRRRCPRPAASCVHMCTETERRDRRLRHCVSQIASATPRSVASVSNFFRVLDSCGCAKFVFCLSVTSEHTRPCHCRVILSSVNHN